MKIKLSTLAAAVTVALAMGTAGQAAASIYGRSYLDVSNLVITPSDDGGATRGGAVITSFNVTTTNQGTVAGAPVSTTDNCATPGGCFYNSGDVTKALDAPQAVGTGGLPRPTQNNFTFMGPDLIGPPAVYGTADSVIHTAELAGDPSTHTTQIAESELRGAGTSASSSAELQSITGFTMLFTVAGANQIRITFDAIADLLSHAIDPSAIFGNAQGNINVEFNLAQLTDSAGGTLGRAVWRPDGINGLFDTCVNGLTCTDTDGYDLNTDTGALLGSPDDGRSGGGNFDGLVTGLDNGNWRLTLNATTSTQLSRTVPEPGVLALMGMGLLGMVMSNRRRKYN